MVINAERCRDIFFKIDAPGRLEKNTLACNGRFLLVCNCMGNNLTGPEFLAETFHIKLSKGFKCKSQGIISSLM